MPDMSAFCNQPTVDIPSYMLSPKSAVIPYSTAWLMLPASHAKLWIWRSQHTSRNGITTSSWSKCRGLFFRITTLLKNFSWICIRKSSKLLDNMSNKPFSLSTGKLPYPFTILHINYLLCWLCVLTTSVNQDTQSHTTRILQGRTPAGPWNGTARWPQKWPLSSHACTWCIINSQVFPLQ